MEISFDLMIIFPSQVGLHEPIHENLTTGLRDKDWHTTDNCQFGKRIVFHSESVDLDTVAMAAAETIILEFYPYWVPAELKHFGRLFAQIRCSHSRVLIFDLMVSYVIVPHNLSIDFGGEAYPNFMRKKIAATVREVCFSDTLLTENLDAELVPATPSTAEATSALLARKVSTLGLSTRAKKVLAAEGIETVGNLVSLQPYTLLKFKNAGETVLKDCVSTLEELGLSLGVRPTML